jgi:hypothetical protein
VGRVWIEAIRIDPSEIFLGLRINIWSAIAGIACGIAIFVIQSRRHPGLEDTVYRPGRQPVAAVPASKEEQASAPLNVESDISNDEGNKLQSDK